MVTAAELGLDTELSKADEVIANLLQKWNKTKQPSHIHNPNRNIKTQKKP